MSKIISFSLLKNNHSQGDIIEKKIFEYKITKNVFPNINKILIHKNKTLTFHQPKHFKNISNIKKRNHQKLEQINNSNKNQSNFIKNKYLIPLININQKEKSFDTE